MKAEIKRVPLAHLSGAGIAVRTYGNGSLPCLLIHGFGEGAYVWEEVIELVALRQKVITLDLPGHGDSSWSENGSYDATGYVQDISVLLEQMGIDECVVVGHSLGGNIAGRLASLRPEKIAGVVLVDSQPEPFPEAKAHVVEAFLDAHRVYGSVDEYLRRLQAERPLPSSYWLKQAAMRATRQCKDGRFVLKSDRRLAQAFARDDDIRGLTDCLRSLECPAMMVRGAYSAMLTEAQAIAIGASMRSCAVVSVPQAGHAVMADNPGGFSSLVGPFLERFEMRI